jgi:UDP-glucose 4-epimerase
MNELTIRLNCKNWTIFRFGNVFGERQDGSTEMGLVGVISYNLKHNTEMEVFNNGENERDYIYVKDVVKALISVSNQDIYQVSQNKTYKTIELINLSGVKYKIGRNNTEVNSIQLDNTKLKQLGWSPTLSVIDYINKIKNG